LIRLIVYLFSRSLNEIVANTKVLATFAEAITVKAKLVLWLVSKVSLLILFRFV